MILKPLKLQNICIELTQSVASASKLTWSLEPSTQAFSKRKNDDAVQSANRVILALKRKIFYF